MKCMGGYFLLVIHGYHARIQLDHSEANYQSSPSDTSSQINQNHSNHQNYKKSSNNQSKASCSHCIPPQCAELEMLQILRIIQIIQVKLPQQSKSSKSKLSESSENHCLLLSPQAAQLEMVWGRPTKPIVVFPLSKHSPDVLGFHGNSVQFINKDNRVGNGLGVDGQLNGSTHFIPPTKSLAFSIGSGSELLSLDQSSFTICGWIYLDALPDTQVRLFGFEGDSKTRMSIEKDKVFAYFGHVKFENDLPFKTGKWYHLGMAYGSSQTKCFIFWDEKKLASKSCRFTGSTSSTFVIGSSLFHGRMACVQVYKSSVGTAYLSELSYRCIHGHPGIKLCY